MSRTIVHHSPVPAPNWREHMNDVEKQRLKVIEDRLQRKQETINELFGEKFKIMRRCIKRMRRAK